MNQSNQSINRCCRQTASARQAPAPAKKTANLTAYRLRVLVERVPPSLRLRHAMPSTLSALLLPAALSAPPPHGDTVCDPCTTLIS